MRYRSVFHLAGLLAAAVAVQGPPRLAQAAPLLLRNPTLGAAQVAFLHGDDIWTAPRRGGAARRITAGGKVRGGPFLSPDGRWLAYSAASGGSTDIFVVAASGGTPRRVTWHPDGENLVGWSPDGESVIFTSQRISGLRGAPRLFRARIDGQGAPEALAMPTASTVSYSPDRSRVAYTPFAPVGVWKGYRGGRASYIWLIDLATLDKVEVPHGAASDWNPMWVGDKVYFLSDRDGPTTLYAYDTVARIVTKAIDNKGFDFMSAQAGPGGIVIDALDSTKVFDLASGKVRTTPIRVKGAGAGLGPRTVKLPGDRAASRVLSPDASAYAIEARGDILVAANAPGMPARNLSDSPAVADRQPLWSPDSRRIAYLSDASGEYRLVVRAADGSGKPQDFSLGEGGGLFEDFHWSPDGRRIAYADERGGTWVLDVETGKSVRLRRDAEGNAASIGGWSRDGRLLAFAAQGANRLNVVAVWSAETGRITAVSDGRLDAFYPVFDSAADRLYFLASGDRPIATASGAGAGRMDWTATAYAADLTDLDAPWIVRLSVPEQAYRRLAPAAGGGLYLLDGRSGEGVVWRLAGPQAKAEPYLGGVEDFELFAGGERALVRRRGQDRLIALAEVRSGPGGEPSPVPAGQAFTVPALPMTVSPKAEWTQIYREGWRLERDLFYSGDFAGLDLVQAQARYAPFLDGLSSRSELTYLMREMFTNLRVGHQYVTDPPPGDPAFGPQASPGPAEKRGGLLGADYEVADGRYRFKRIFGGDVWRPEGRGPLATPGVRVKQGDYLVAVDGREVLAEDNLDRIFDGLADRPVEIRVSDSPTGARARTYKVTPVANEFNLRHVAWVEDNRLKVDRLSGGKLGYIYLINTGDEAYNAFNRDYLAQIDKQGLIFDERNNAGGPMPQYFIDRLSRTATMLGTTRYRATPRVRPENWLDGPSAMIVNEAAGSGGDMLPYMYQKARIGPVVGTRTWGGTIGSSLVPTLLDGATMAVPHFANSDPDGTWGGLEGSGVLPDIPVQMEPRAVMAGGDPQLEAAVKAVIDELSAHPRPVPIAPPSFAPKPVAAR